MNKLNKFGVSKILPFIQDINSDVYQGSNSVYAKDDKIIVDAFPLKMIEEARTYGIHMICSGTDNRHYYFDIFHDPVITEEEIPDDLLKGGWEGVPTATKPQTKDRVENIRKLKEMLIKEVGAAVMKQVKEMMAIWNEQFKNLQKQSAKIFQGRDVGGIK